MKTLIALLCLASSCLGQSIHDLEKTKVRMRIQVTRFTPLGSLCDAAFLAKNKLGREEPQKNPIKDPFAPASPSIGQGIVPIVINVIDLSMQSAKPGEIRDLSLYPVAQSTVPLYAINASNVVLYQQGRFKNNISRDALGKMSFEATLYEVLASIEGAHAKATPMVITQVKGKTDEMKESWAHQLDVVIKGDINVINNAPKYKGVPRVRLYPTSLPKTFTLTLEDALKELQVSP